jgi:hypothetical protein
MVRIKGIKPENIIRQISRGIRIRVDDDDIEVQIAGVSYGIFRI